MKDDKERMKAELQAELISGKLKVIEQQIVTFYREIGRLEGLNMKATEIFAYLQIYEVLTQEQLKKLTKFSLSTISTTLQSFLRTDIVAREVIPNARKSRYRLKAERVTFIYIPFTQIIEELEQFDLLIVQLQAKLQDLREEYPIIAEFLHLRLNSIRNYIEVQRRAINEEKRFPFFQEKVAKLTLPSKNEIITYPPEIRDLEEKLADILVKRELFVENDPIANRIMAFLITRQKIDQEMLIHLTGFSRSTISRNLQKALNMDYIKALPKEYRKPRVYYLESVALGLINVILNSDYFIFSWMPKFQRILQELQSDPRFDYDNRKMNDFLQEKIRKILQQIEEFKTVSKLLEQAQKELQLFLGLKEKR